MELKRAISQCAETWDSFYLYDESCILESVARLQAGFPQVDFLYSVKCNPNPHVLGCVFRQGLGADAASAGEVELARKAGLPAGRIYYSAPGKSAADIEKSLSQAVLIADSIGEIERIEAAARRAGRAVSIGIRINPDFSFAGEGGNPSKFGIDEDQALRFLRANPCKNVKVTGIHVHLKSQELDAAVLSSYYERVFRLASRFAQACGGLDYVNMGSGMGVAFTPADPPLDLPVVSAAFQKNLPAFRLSCPETKIIIEVGRYAVSKSGFYVTKVMDRKQSRGKTYLILKNTLNGFLRPSLARLVARYAAESAPTGLEPLFSSFHAFEFLSLKEDPPSERVTLAGNLCTAADVIAEDILMPRLECGDIVVVTNAGGYGAALSPFQFSSQEKPAELFLTQSGEIL